MSARIGIGALSKSTGVPVETLRTWERRYGVPEATRTEGGHRLYAPEWVERLQLVARALAAGHRAQAVVPATSAELWALLAETRAAPGVLGDWLTAAATLDGEALVRGFAQELARLGAISFLQDRALPFLHAVGERWESGELRIFQEHAASERLHDFLVQTWRPMAAGATGPLAVLATPTGERHDLALHMAALTLASDGFRILYLGADTPSEEIVDAASQSRASLVVISVSGAHPGAEATLLALRHALPASIPLLVGGRVAPEVGGITHASDYSALLHLARAHV